MIDKPVPLSEAVFSTLEREVSPEVAASLAALQLGSSQMMFPATEMVYEEFSSDADLQWPKIPQNNELEISEADLGVADEIAGTITRQRDARNGGAATFLGQINRALFGEDPREARRYAMALSLANMVHTDPLIKVTAAIASLSFVRNPIRVGQAVNILNDALAQPDDALTNELAFTGLSRFFFSPVWSPFKQIGSLAGRLFGAQPSTSTSASQNTTVLVHGTVFQRHGQPLDQWWRPPAGDLHQYLKNGPRPNVYGGADHYRWSGGWNDYAREEAAEKLVDWMDRRGIQSPDVFAHSHGGNVAILANQARAFNTLVLMSCPVHWTRHPINCVKALSIRIRWDLVIMADGGGQRFPPSTGIDEHVLPFWFTGHEASRQSKNWKSQNLEKLL